MTTGATVWPLHLRASQYWEGTKTSFILRPVGETTETVVRVPAWVYEKQTDRRYRLVFVGDPDKYYHGCRIYDPMVVSLNSKEW